MRFLRPLDAGTIKDHVQYEKAWENSTIHETGNHCHRWKEHEQPTPANTEQQAEISSAMEYSPDDQGAWEDLGEKCKDQLSSFTSEPGIFYPHLVKRKKNNDKNEVTDKMRTFKFLISRNVLRERHRI